MFRPPRFMLAAVALACATGWAPAVLAQAPAGAAAPAAAPAQGTYTAAQLETLVGPIALYADDLIAIVLPASTYPLQVVQVDRWLEKRKTNKDLKVDDNWDDSVKSLANYPDIIKKMSTDLDWTEALGEAVATSNNEVMDAIQAFRRKAHSAGNLKSDDKQVIKVEQQIIQIEPANPEVVYVPTYNPAQVVTYGSPYYYGWSSAYPAYWYPYAPGAAFAAGIVWGAAMGAIWSGGRYVSHYGGGNNNITINRGNNNINTGNINRGQGGNSTWKPSNNPRQGAASARQNATNRVGDAGRGGNAGNFGGGAGAGNRGGAGGGIGDGGRAGGGAGVSNTGRHDSAFGGMDSGAAANRASQRGADSRGSSFGGGSRDGGARASSHGGGARAGGRGGGGRGGGGRR